MGLGENCGPGDHHPTTLYEYFEKVLIPGLKIPVPGLKRRVEIQINGFSSNNNECVSGVEAHLLLGGKSVHRTFYPLHSSEANAFLRKYQPKFAEESDSAREIRTAHAEHIYNLI